MFITKKEKFGKFTKIKILNIQTKEYISIIPDFGANVNKIILSRNNKLFPILDGYKTYSSLIEDKWSKGKKMIPFPNRIDKGQYTFQGKKYQLPINYPKQGHAIHGLIYNKKFKINKIINTKKQSSVILEYKYKREIHSYPFCFLVKIKYSLNNKGFKTTTKIQNLDSTDIPIGDGWHPYFKINGLVNKLFLKIPAKKKILVDKKMIPTGKYQKIEKFTTLTKIEKTAFDTGFIVTKSKIARTLLCSKKLNITLNIWQETGNRKYNYLQIFIPPSRKSIAIEPMTCDTNALNNKKGLIILKPNQTLSASYGVYID